MDAGSGRAEIGVKTGGWRGAISALRRQTAPRTTPETPDLGGRPHDWLFVTAAETRGWILDAICREIGSRQAGTWTVNYGDKVLPPARTYFFAHYALYVTRLARNPQLANARTLIWYTHPREIGVPIDEQIAAYNQATCIVFPCSMFREALIAKGLERARTAVVLGAADPDVFRAHRRGQGVVGLSSAFYERKNPDTLLELVGRLPHRRFHLLGKGWENYARWAELTAAPNFTYESIPYADYPSRYARFDVFLSLSTVEGGPISLMETMMCNAAPVVSRTGFAPDIIEHGRNGFIFDLDAPSEVIAGLVEQAFALKTDVRETVRHYTWDRFAREVHNLADSAHDAGARA